MRIQIDNFTLHPLLRNDNNEPFLRNEWDAVRFVDHRFRCSFAATCATTGTKLNISTIASVARQCECNDRKESWNAGFDPVAAQRDDHSRTWTYNHQIKSLQLYRLSYVVNPPFPIASRPPNIIPKNYDLLNRLPIVPWQRAVRSLALGIVGFSQFFHFCLLIKFIRCYIYYWSIIIITKSAHICNFYWIFTSNSEFQVSGQAATWRSNLITW